MWKNSAEDEEWLDGAANLSDEGHVLDILKSYDGSFNAAVANMSGTQKIAYKNMLINERGKLRLINWLVVSLHQYKTLNSKL